jgi:hypothetical protein
MTREVMNKPFARFLPGHPTAARMVVFLTGLVVSILTAALLMWRGGSNAPGTPIMFCAAVCLNMTVYLAGAGLVLMPWTTKSPLVGLLFGVTFAAVPLIGWRLFVWIELMIARHPVWMILGGVLTSSAIWLRMGQNEWGRQLFSLGLRFNRAVAAKELYGALERRYTREAAASDIMASLFANRMGNAPDYGASRYIWGTFYAKWGSLAVWWKWLVFASVAISVPVLYTSWVGAAVAFLWVSWVIVPQAWPPIHSTILVPAGRRERFLSTISLAAVTSGIVASWIVVVSILSVPLSILVPAVEVWDLPLTCKPIPFGIVSVPLIVVPLRATCLVLLPRRWDTAGAIATGPLLLFGMMAAVMIWVWMEIFSVRLAREPLLWIVAAVALAWTLFLSACRWRTRFLALAGQ